MGGRHFVEGGCLRLSRYLTNQEIWCMMGNGRPWPDLQFNGRIQLNCILIDGDTLKFAHSDGIVSHPIEHLRWVLEKLPPGVDVEGSFRWINLDTGGNRICRPELAAPGSPNRFAVKEYHC